jgi:hypothetical protein
VYVTLAELKAGSAFDPAGWDELNTRRPATIAAWLRMTQSDIDDPLRLRYAVPFATTPPNTTPDPSLAPKTVKNWQISLLDARFLDARRNAGTSLSEDNSITRGAERAREAIAAAADQDRAAHHELPLLADKPWGTGVSKGGPLVATYMTPYGFFDAMAARRDEGGW